MDLIKRHISRFTRKTVLFCIVFMAVILLFSDDTKANSDKRVVRVAYFEYENFNELNGNDAYYGLGYEYLMQIAKYANWEYEFVSYSKKGEGRLDYTEAIEMLEAGEVDLMGLVRKNDYNEHHFLFPSMPSGSSTNILTVMENSDYEKDAPETYDGMRIGVLRENVNNSLLHQYIAKNQIRNIQLFPYDNTWELYGDMEAGKIDAVYSSNMRKMGKERAILTLGMSDFYFAINKNQDEICEEFSKAIERIYIYTPNFSNNLINKYYYNASVGEYVLSDDQKGYIEHNPEIKVAVCPQYPPFVYMDSTGECRGIMLDLMREVEERIGIRFEITFFDNNEEAIQAVGQGDYELYISAPFNYTWADDRNVRLTTKIFDFPNKLVMRKMLNLMDDTEQLRIACLYKSPKEELIRQLYNNVDIEYYKCWHECIDAVNSGKADMTIIPLYTSDVLLDVAKYKKLQTFDLTEITESMTFAIGKEADYDLYNIIEGAVTSLTDEKINRIVMENVLVYEPEKSFEDFIYENSVILLAVVFLILVIVLVAIIVVSRISKRASKQKRLDEEKIHLAISRTSIAIWDYDIKMKSITNRLSPSDEEERTVHDIPESQIKSGVIHPGSVSMYRKMYEKLMEGEKALTCEIQKKDARGEYHWYRISYTRLADIDEESHAIGVSELIDEHKKLEQAYKVEQMYRESMSMDAIDYFMINVTKDKIEEVKMTRNSNYSELALYTTMDVLDYINSKVDNLEDREMLAAKVSVQAFKRMFNEGKKETKFEFRCTGEKSKVVWRELLVKLIENPYSNNLMAFLFVRSITLERRAELIRETMHKTMQLAIDNSFEYLIIIDMVNMQYEYIRHPEPFSMPEKGDVQILQKYVEMYVTDDIGSSEYKADLFAMLNEMLDKGKVERQVRMRVSGKEDYAWYKVVAQPEKNEISGAVFCVLMLNDITVIKNAEEKLRAALMEATQATQAKQNFLANMSHEIRTPLNGIKGMLDLLREEEDYEKNNYLEKAALSADHLLALVNDILDMSKIDSGKIQLREEYVQKYEIITYIMAVIMPLAQEKSVTVVREIEQAPYDGFYADGGRLRQILINVLSNAVKYTNSGGTVHFRVSFKKGRGKLVNVKYQIQDNGIGMSKEFLKKAFEPFEQESKGYSRMGTGLGLAITKQLVELMGGTIKIDSALNKGTTVTINLKFIGVEKGETASVPVDNVRKDGEPSFEGKRALIAEDHPINMEIADRQLTKLGIMVDKVTNGEEALRAFANSENGYYDVIFMDIMMPIMDGFEATKAIRSMGRPDSDSVSIVAMTANAFAEDVNKSLESGMNYHLSKPFDKKQLNAILTDIFIGRK